MKLLTTIIDTIDCISTIIVLAVLLSPSWLLILVAIKLFFDAG